MPARFPPCILCTCVVPWDEKGNFIESLFVDQVRQMATKCTPNLYVFGTAGEGYAVTDSQFLRITQVFSETMRSCNAEPMVGVISLSLGVIQERIERARDLGVRLFQIALPCWGALEERELFEFFRQTCGRFPDCRFVHYNLPRTKRIVTADEYARLAAEHPNLVGTKNCTDVMDRLHGLMTLAGDLTHFPGETGYIYASQIGPCGLLASLATNYRSIREFFEAGQKRDMPKLLAMQRELDALTKDLIGTVGSEVHIDGTFDKMLWKLHDERFPLRLLPPYLGATDEAYQKFARAVREKYPRWAPE